MANATGDKGRPQLELAKPPIIVWKVAIDARMHVCFFQLNFEWEIKLSLEELSLRRKEINGITVWERGDE
jgi:hypothetical protein